MAGLQMATLEGPEAVLDGGAVEAFRTGLRGRSFAVGEEGYDDERIIWNGSADKRPALIVQCSGTADVIDAVNFARENGLLVAVRGGGHNVAGNAMCDDGLVIDLSAMNEVRVDPTARTARVAGGAILGDVDRETQLLASRRRWAWCLSPALPGSRCAVGWVGCAANTAWPATR